LIGSIRGECLDHVVVFEERHLRHVLSCYVEYYNATRTHLSLCKDTPIGRVVQLGALNANLFSVTCTSNMREFDLRQAQQTTSSKFRRAQKISLDLMGLPLAKCLGGANGHGDLSAG
jgi:hypothetical protein